LKVRGDEQSVTNSGKLLHARGPASNAKALYCTFLRWRCQREDAEGAKNG